MDNFLENKKIAFFVVNSVSKMYHLDDAVLVEFHPSSRFPNPEVTAIVNRINGLFKHIVIKFIYRN